MRTVQKILAIIAVVVLSVQAARHAYVLWLQPRHSVLDRWEKPLKDEIAAAKSLDDLARLYEAVHQEADKSREARKASGDDEAYGDWRSDEPFKSETQIEKAIREWEGKVAELRELRFYWVVGLAFLLLGFVCYRYVNEWIGLALEIAGFSEFVYWTSPTFLGDSREFTALLAWKLALTLASLVLLLVTAALQGALRHQASDQGPQRIAAA